jgi:hypothetical protein
MIYPLLALRLTVWIRRIKEKPEGMGMTNRMTLIAKCITIQKGYLRSQDSLVQ